jgi:hypothetical protein
MKKLIKAKPRACAMAILFMLDNKKKGYTNYKENCNILGWDCLEEEEFNLLKEALL